MTKLSRYMKLSQQHAKLMPQMMPELANEEVITKLKATLEDYKRLLEEGIPSYPFYTAQDIESKIADVLELTARTYESLSHTNEYLNNITQSIQYYQQAAKAYEKNGEGQKAESCRNNRAQLINTINGNVEAEIRRINEALKRLTVNTLDHTQKLIELAELYNMNEDDYQAQQLLKRAEEALKHLNSNPSGIDLATALTQSLQNIQSGQPTEGRTPIEKLVSIRDLYRRLYLCQARILTERGEITEADEKMKLAEQMDSPQLNQEFSAQISQSLNSLYQGFD